MRLRGIELRGEWTDAEIQHLAKIFKDLPDGLVEANPNFKAVERRPVLLNAPPEAPGHSKYEPLTGTIVVFDKGVYDGEQIDPEQFRRSVCHELAHSIIRSNPSEFLQLWSSSTHGDGFVDEYAKTSPEEDFCDTFSEYLIDPRRTAEAVPKKASFVRRLLASSSRQEKVAMHFMRGFSDELLKTAGPGPGRLARFFLRRGGHAAEGMGGLSIGKRLAIGGGAAGAAGAAGVIGAKMGKKKGYEQGTAEEMEVAQAARALGRREGVIAYHNALQNRLREGGE